jgi:hypothetical protein
MKVAAEVDSINQQELRSWSGPGSQRERPQTDLVLMGDVKLHQDSNHLHLCAVQTYYIDELVIHSKFDFDDAVPSTGQISQQAPRSNPQGQRQEQ